VQKKGQIQGSISIAMRECIFVGTIWKEEATAFSDGWNGMLSFVGRLRPHFRLQAYQLRSVWAFHPMGKLA